MLRFVVRAGLTAAALVLGACSSRPLPKYEKPIARTHFQQVRTTAYTHTEADHLQHGRSTALGGTLQSTNVRSAAADWSRWPAGTMFRIVETGELYRVDDYGWALAGTNTIDLYKPSRDEMNRWGVRRVTIENMEWGDVDRSLAVLKPRTKYRHVKRMVNEIESRYAELHRPVEAPPQPVATEIPVARAETVTPARAEPVGRVAATSPTTSAPRSNQPPLTPFRAIR